MRRKNRLQSRECTQTRARHTAHALARSTSQMSARTGPAHQVGAATQRGRGTYGLLTLEMNIWQTMAITPNTMYTMVPLISPRH